MTAPKPDPAHPDADELDFAPEDEAAPPKGKGAAVASEPHPWRVLIVDDDPDIHAVTKLSLRKVEFQHRRLEFLSAYSAREAREVLSREQGIAIILLDVVMESDNAGLELVGWIRNDLRETTSRIILRTGQPGQAPEQRVIVDFDINDYKSKAELTADKLFTSTIAALRSYGDLMTIEASRRGLERIIEAADRLVERDSIRQFAAGVLTQLGALLQTKVEGIVLFRRGEAGRSVSAGDVLAGSGQFLHLVDHPEQLDLYPAMRGAIDRAVGEDKTVAGPGWVCLLTRTESDEEFIVWIEPARELSPTDLGLVRVLGTKLAASFRNVVLYEQLRLANERLEARVEERTQELAGANDRLIGLNAELQRLAVTDPLTGLSNRRGILAAGERELARVRRSGTRATVVSIDLDHFKHINDTAGHAGGDAVLTTLGALLQANVRTQDQAGRVGGEEFLVVLADTELAGAQIFADRLRARIAATPVQAAGHLIEFTASLGLAQLRTTDETLDPVLARADRALYRAKENGRNRVEVEFD